MRIAVDSSVLWSIFKREPDGPVWLDFFVELSSEHTLVVCEIVVAELAPYFARFEQMQARLLDLDLDFDAIHERTAFAAGLTFREYRRHGGPRERLLPDFLIAAHGVYQANALAASDLGFLRRYFPRLNLLRPPRR